MFTRMFAGALMPVLIASLAGCTFPGTPNPAERPVRPDQVVSFSKLFGKNCAGCHGADGKMGAAPPLNDPVFRSIVPIDVVEESIAAGRHGTLMPSFAKKQGGALTAAQIKILAFEIVGQSYTVTSEGSGETTTFSVRADPKGITPSWGAVQPSDKLPKYVHNAKKGDRQRGAKVYANACAICHGYDGEGDMAGALNQHAFLSLSSDQMLRRIVITGRPDLGMPGYADDSGRSLTFEPLSDQDISDVVALLAHWRASTSNE